MRLWLAATAKDSQVRDMWRQELATAQLNPSSSSQLADKTTGNSLEFAKFGKAPRVASRKIGIYVAKWLKWLRKRDVWNKLNASEILRAE